MMPTVNEANNGKTKVPDVFIFRSVSLVCFTAEVDMMSKLIHNRRASKLNIKTTAAYVHKHEQLGLCFYILVRYFVVLDIHL